MVSRRRFAASAGLAVVTGIVRGPLRAWARPADALSCGLARIEAESGGRLGVALVDTVSGTRLDHRGTERFPLCSTFKVLAAAAVLARVDRGEERLDTRVRFEAGDVVPYSPFTGSRAGGEGAALVELCEAAITLSDNTAANLLLGTIGGPDGLTAFVRTLGDDATRLDRTEPDLNEARPGDPRDTTTPLAMADTLHRLVLADTLTPASRALLTAWLVGNRTGEGRLRAGLPKDWRVGDKTGSGENNTGNDVAVLWPPHRSPLILTAYLTGAQPTPEARSATLAAVARAVTEASAR